MYCFDKFKFRMLSRDSISYIYIYIYIYRPFPNFQLKILSNFRLKCPFKLISWQFTVQTANCTNSIRYCRVYRQYFLSFKQHPNFISRNSVVFKYRNIERFKELRKRKETRTCHHLWSFIDGQESLLVHNGTRDSWEITDRFATRSSRFFESRTRSRRSGSGTSLDISARNDGRRRTAIGRHCQGVLSTAGQIGRHG